VPKPQQILLEKNSTQKNSSVAVYVVTARIFEKEVTHTTLNQQTLVSSPMSEDDLDSLINVFFHLTPLTQVHSSRDAGEGM
jgi:hypothetical protein